MNTIRLILAACTIAVTLPLFAQDKDERPILKEPQARLVLAMQAMADEISMSASVNVTHDIAQKRIRIFSVVPDAKVGEFNKYGYQVEIIYNAKLASSKVGNGAYYSQSNYLILAFAGAQFASGKKELGRWLVEILAASEPDLFWSSPTHPVMTIQQISVGLKSDDKTVKDFLEDRNTIWAEIMDLYGPR